MGFRDVDILISIGIANVKHCCIWRAEVGGSGGSCECIRDKVSITHKQPLLGVGC